MTRVIAIMNQKGGVGKTTTTVNLGAALSEKLFKVLLIDLDPAGSMTQWLSGEHSDNHPGLADLLDGESPDENITRKSERLGLDYIPAGNRLRDLATNGSFGLYMLKDRLKESIKNYDFILIDCPPSSDILVGNALLASDYIIIPIQTETLPLQAGIKFLDWLDEFSERNQSSINIMGLLPCMYDSRTRLSKLILDAMRSSENIGPLVFDTVIRKNVRLAELSASDRSIFRSASTSYGASDYSDLAIEVLEKSGLALPDPSQAQSSITGVDEDPGSVKIESESDVELVYRDSGSGEYVMTEPTEEPDGYLN